MIGKSGGFTIRSDFASSYTIDVYVTRIVKNYNQLLYFFFQLLYLSALGQTIYLVSGRQTQLPV